MDATSAWSEARGASKKRASESRGRASRRFKAHRANNTRLRSQTYVASAECREARRGGERAWRGMHGAAGSRPRGEARGRRARPRAPRASLSFATCRGRAPGSRRRRRTRRRTRPGTRRIPPCRPRGVAERGAAQAARARARRGGRKRAAGALPRAPTMPARSIAVASRALARDTSSASASIGTTPPRGRRAGAAPTPCNTRSHVEPLQLVHESGAPASAAELAEATSFPPPDIPTAPRLGAAGPRDRGERSSLLVGLVSIAGNRVTTWKSPDCGRAQGRRVYAKRAAPRSRSSVIT